MLSPITTLLRLHMDEKHSYAVICAMARGEEHYRFIKQQLITDGPNTGQPFYVEVERTGPLDYVLEQFDNFVAESKNVK